VLASSYLTEREFASPKSTEPIPSFNRFASKLGFRLHHEDSDGPDFARQTRGPGSRDRLLALFMKKKLSHAPATGESRLRSPEGTTTAKVVGAGITGMLSFVSAVFTTVVESGGFWQYFWLAHPDATGQEPVAQFDSHSTERSQRPQRQRIFYRRQGR
jgi:hypothetical protein